MKPSERHSPAVVLGAGPAGLSAAVTLSQAGYKVFVIEKQSYLGGLSATFQHGPFRLDFGPHAFHRMNDETDALYHKFCNKGSRDIFMKASLLLHGKYFDYPLKFGEALLRLEPSFTAKMLFDYFRAQVRKISDKTSEESFEDWGVKRYGRAIYEMAFGSYSRKVWGMPTSQLHWKLARQKLPDMKFRDLIRETFGGKKAKQKRLYASYAYPNSGIGTVFERMGKEILKSNGEILLEAEPQEIIFEDNRAVALNIREKNKSQRIPCSVIFNSIPLNHLVKSCYNNAPKTCQKAARSLIYRHLMMAYLEVDKKNITNEIMVYLLDPEFTFNRIGEQKNIAPEMIPKNRSMLCFEICTDENSEWWHMPDHEFLNRAEKDLLKLGTVHPEEIKDGFVKRLKQAYPIYDLSFDQNLMKVFDWLESLDNIYSLGRQGLFLNNDIHTSMKMGMEAARHFISGEPQQKRMEYTRRYLDWHLK